MADPPRNVKPTATSTVVPSTATVSCVLAIDGGERLAKDWPQVAVSYISAILRQLNNVHPNADIQVAPVIINSLPPTSRRPLVVRQFRPVAQTMTEMPNLLGGKGKQRESTSDQDFALLEGLLIASSLLEAQQSSHSYLVLVSAQDIPNTNFWDEEIPGMLPFATAWPDIGPSTGMAPEAFNTSQAWQRLCDDLAKNRTHFCTITTRFLPRLEDFQRKVANAKGLASQALPNLQNPEHAILLTGFQSALSAQAKRPHSDSVSASPREVKDYSSQPAHNGQNSNKRVKLSPNMVARSLSKDDKEAGTAVKLDSQSTSAEVTQNKQGHMPVPQEPPDQATAKVSPSKLLLSIASAQGGAQAPVDASAVFQPQQQQIQDLAQQPFSVADLQQKREEVKTQMRQFLTSLSSMAKAKQLSMEQARATAEQVRAEAVKKLQLLDMLEQQTMQRSPSLSVFGMQLPPEAGGQQQSPANSFQHMNQRNGSLPPNLSPMLQQNQQLQNGQQQPQHQFPQGFPGHQRTASYSSNTPSSTYLPTPGQTFSQLQPQSTTPSGPIQTPQTQPKILPNVQPGSPGKAPAVWSGPIQWSLVDPQTKQKRELAFYVDAVPMRSSAAVELMNLQWPSTLEIAHISAMPMVELQKYASDNRIQVIQFIKAPAHIVENLGMSQGQNDSLYKLLAKSLEDKSSVATIKLPAAGQNRGIIVVALPGQAKLVGLLFLHTSLPPRTPAGNQSDQTLQQQQSQAPSMQQQHPPVPLRADNRNNDGQSSMAPLASPSFLQHKQTFMQQMQMPAPLQQMQQIVNPANLHSLSANFGAQPKQQFTSPGFPGNIQLPTTFPMNTTTSTPNHVFNTPAHAPFGNNSNNNNGSSSAPSMSDAQFQELLASLQK